MSFVYALVDPRDWSIRYIGGTTNDLEDRLSSHVTYAKSNKADTHSSCWIRSLLEQGMRPIIVPLENCPTDFGGREKYWIAFMRGTGADLTNHSDGGEQNAGWSTSEEKKLKLSIALKKHKRTPEHCAAISAAKKGISTATEETRAKMSVVHLGCVITQEMIEKRKVTRAGYTHSEETRAKLSASGKAYYANKQ